MADKPFLTLITRCCERPGMLTQAIESVLAQTDRDVEIVFIVDRQRRGVLWANKQFAAHRDHVRGEFVYALDDDCVLVNKRLVARLKALRDRPGVIMVRCERPQLSPILLPKPAVWGKRNKLRVTSTNGGCFVVRADLWRKHIKRYRVAAAGDWHFLNGLKNDTTATFGWLDIHAMKTLQLGRGKKFEKVKGNWFKPVARKFNIQHVNDNVWRLALWSL